MNRWLTEHATLPLMERACGRRTFSVYRQLKKSQWLSREQLESLQLQKLQSLIKHAIHNTAGYADWAKLSRDFVPQSLEQLTELPLMSRPLINDRREELTCHDVPGGAIRYRTGGSSGSPMIFYIDRRRQSWDKAARMRSHLWYGLPPGVREAYFWNAPVELGKQDRIKAFRDRLINERLLPANELSANTVGQFITEFRAFRPACLYGYASSLTLLCELAAQAGLRLDTLGIKTVFTTAETLLDHQRNTLTESFGGATVGNNYGSREGGYIAHTCPHGCMHITSENVIVEILRPDGQPCGPGEEGELVVTQLDCYAMPLIRYRTGDIAAWSDCRRCECGRELHMLEAVRGRSNDFLVMPDGRYIHSSALHAALSGFDGIEQFQFCQAADFAVTMSLVSNERFTTEARQQLVANLQQRFGPRVAVTINDCETIPPSPSGKFRYVISELDRLHITAP